MSACMIIRTCPACHKKYSFDPSVGKFICPHCRGLGKLKKKTKVNKLFSEKI